MAGWVAVTDPVWQSCQPRSKNYCDNVERLARVEIARRALRDFVVAAGHKADP